MSDYDRTYGRPTTEVGSGDMSLDVGLRKFMLGVYNKLALGLVVTAALAFLTSSYAPVAQLLYRFAETPNGVRLAGVTTLGMIVQFAPLVVILGSMFALRNPSPRSAGILYWTIVSLIGAGAGVWLLLYTGTSVASTFLITATAFGALSLVGYTTKKNLTGFGSFLIMGMWGLLAASLVNIFLNIPGFSFVISVIGVLIFSGLIAYDTQRLKMTYYALGGDQAALGVATNFGALSLYINFINLFQFLLMIFGGRRE